MVLGAVLLPANSYGRHQDTSLCCPRTEAPEAALPNLTGATWRWQFGGGWIVTEIQHEWGFQESEILGAALIVFVRGQ